MMISLFHSSLLAEGCHRRDSSIVPIVRHIKTQRESHKKSPNEDNLSFPKPQKSAVADTEEYTFLFQNEDMRISFV